VTILFVSIEFNYCCGVSQSIYSLSRELKKRGHKVILGTPGGTMVEAFKEQGMIHEWIPVRPRKKSIGDFTNGIRSIREIVRKHNVDVIHSHNRLADFFVKLANVIIRKPAVISAHALVSGGKFTSFKADRIIAVSTAVREMLEDYFNVKEDKILVARNIPRQLITPTDAASEAFRSSLKIPEDSLIVAGIGRLHPEKGFDVLLQAAAFCKVKELHFLIVGKGAEEDALKMFAKEKGINVTFVDETSHVELVYSIADLVIVPSRQESAGLVAIEAGFLNKPVITSAVGGLTETIIDSKTGLLFPSEDAVALAAKIDQLASDKEQRKMLGEQLHKHVSAMYDPGEITQRIENLYNELLK
jgi:glycosyltransferase involved in cell wall biosynthesis